MHCLHRQLTPLRPVRAVLYRLWLQGALVQCTRGLPVARVCSQRQGGVHGGARADPQGRPRERACGRAGGGPHAAVQVRLVFGAWGLEFRVLGLRLMVCLAPLRPALLTCTIHAVNHPWWSHPVQYGHPHACRMGEQLGYCSSHDPVRANPGGTRWSQEALAACQTLNCVPLYTHGVPLPHPPVTCRPLAVFSAAPCGVPTRWEEMKRLLAAAAPASPPGAKEAYHYLTYGWLAGGVAEVRPTGRRMDARKQREGQGAGTAAQEEGHGHPVAAWAPWPLSGTWPWCAPWVAGMLVMRWAGCWRAAVPGAGAGGVRQAAGSGGRVLRGHPSR